MPAWQATWPVKNWHGLPDRQKANTNCQKSTPGIEPTEARATGQTANAPPPDDEPEPLPLPSPPPWLAEPEPEPEPVPLGLDVVVGVFAPHGCWLQSPRAGGLGPLQHARMAGLVRCRHEYSIFCVPPPHCRKRGEGALEPISTATLKFATDFWQQTDILLSSRDS
jgi:hypothetical protein